jgi:D-tyrosyl-tRNA(Tyr) deacylase
MRLLIQRVTSASVSIEGKIHAAIGPGLLAFLGVGQDDTEADAEWLASKMVGMRIFSDSEGKMNLGAAEQQAGILVISQFTLYADTKKGNRPSFIRAAKPDLAIPLYDHFVKCCAEIYGKDIATGVFGADMQVQLVNDGPVTIWIDSKERE